PGSRNASHLTGDDDLARTVIVRNGDDARVLVPRGLTGVANKGRFQSEYRGHGARPVFGGILHQLGSSTHQAESGVEIDDVCRIQGRVFADTMSGNGKRLSVQTFVVQS